MVGKVYFTVRQNICPNGWDGTERKPTCNYTGGHFCDRDKGHTGRCRCSCGSTHAQRDESEYELPGDHKRRGKA